MQNTAVTQKKRARLKTESGTPQKIVSTAKHARTTTKIGKSGAREAQKIKKGQIGPRETARGRAACGPTKKRECPYTAQKQLQSTIVTAGNFSSSYNARWL